MSKIFLGNTECRRPSPAPAPYLNEKAKLVIIFMHEMF